ncbi:MAG: metalloregulator ArsR/SmtB family transcription factor [Sandaracinus sp.]
MSTAARRARLSDVLFALADPTRLAIVEHVAQAPRRASELADSIGASRPSMSRHLRILREAGILEDEDDAHDGRATQIVLAHGPFDEVRDFVDELQGFWESQLASFQKVAEARASAHRAPARKRKAS